MSPYAANSGVMQTLPIFVIAVCKQNKYARKILEICPFNCKECSQFDYIIREKLSIKHIAVRIIYLKFLIVLKAKILVFVFRMPTVLPFCLFD